MVITICRAFYQLYCQGYVYQRYMPVYWSPSSGTALAESELEYNSTHKSVSAYIRFELQSASTLEQRKCYLLIWTTTPWSLVANRAICFDPDSEYAVIEMQDGGKDCYIVAYPLLKASSDLKVREELGTSI